MLDPNDLFNGSSVGDMTGRPQAAPSYPSQLTPMMEQSVPAGGFTSPQAEIDFLRAEVARREAYLQAHNGHESIHAVQPEQRMEMVSQVVHDYRHMEQPQVLHESHRLTQPEVAEIALNLKPELHDDRIGDLYGTMIAKGIKNALSVIETTQNAHLDDDFHRFLVQYLLEAKEVPGLQNTSELYNQLDTTLYEVTLPRPDDQSERRSFKEFISAMEQFYAGMQSVFALSKKKDTGFSVEIARACESAQIVFYVAVPNIGKDLFEKHVLGVYPTARLNPVPDDYNIMNPSGIIAGGYITYEADEILPIKTYDQFESDPINVLLNVFSKLQTGTEGAAIQIVLHPTDESVYKEYVKVLEKLRKGEKLKDIRKSITMFSLIKDMAVGEEKKEGGMSDDNSIEKVTQKIASLMVRATIRVIASSDTPERADALVRDITSAFHQFTDPRSNRLNLKKVEGRALFPFAHEYVYRTAATSESMVMNLRELSTLYHFPALSTDSSELKQAKAATAPAPMDLSTQGIILGSNEHRGVVTPIHYGREDRVRHFYIIGQTGTGKTGFLMNMAIQDIKNGDGVCYIDPHGEDIQRILSVVPPERMDDVIYFDPAYTARPMGLNMLEYDFNKPEQMSLVIDEMMQIFNQLFDMKASGGAMFEQYFKNSTFLVMGHPESGNTLMEISRVLSDKAFRDMKLKHCKSPFVQQFWKNAEATTGESGLSNFVPYITSKFDPLISNEFLRPIVTQEKSAFNIRQVMDNKKILLVNLSKGLLGNINANLLGLILVGKIQMATMARADGIGGKPDFYLYIDEFQNFTTPSIESILSEARKYRLSLNVAHQFLAQLDDGIRNAIFGNVGTMATCRISQEDAEKMEAYFKPFFGASDITKLENMNCYMKLLAGGTPQSPFNMKNKDLGDVYKLSGLPETKDRVAALKELSYLRYGRPRAEIEQEIYAKFETNNKKPSIDDLGF